jgi:microcystin-dependent protein
VGAQFTPTVHDFNLSLSGTGRGTVTSYPVTIYCSNMSGSPAKECSADFEYGTEVTLTATPAVGSVFGGWNNEDCDDSSMTCTTTVFGPETISAEFSLTTRTLSITKTGDGEGAVTSSFGPIDCGPICMAEYDFDSTITLTANAEMYSEFAGWSGACTGTSTTCEVSLTKAAEVTAQFNLIDYSIAVTLAGSGSGSVISSPEGIECAAGRSCSTTFSYGTDVSLTATPDSGSIFSGWGGDICATTLPNCTVRSIDQAQSVTATFEAKPLTAPLVTSIGLGEKKQGQIQAQGMSYYIAFDGAMPTVWGDIVQDKPYIGQIMPYPSDLQPSGWLRADGSVLPVSEYPELFDVIGDTYGGDGETNFAVPDLRARVPVGVGTIQDATIPSPSEGKSMVPLISSMALGEVVQGQFEALGVNFMIAREGNYPQRDGADTSSPLVGEIRIFAGDVIPSGWVVCDGSMLPINSQNLPLYSVLGTTYGGDGQAHFNLPDFRARAPMHVGDIDVDSPPDWTENQIPLVESMGRGDVASGQIGTLGIRIGIARTGLFPSTGGDVAAGGTLIGQTLMFGGVFMPGGWYPADGGWYFVDAMDFNFDEEPALYFLLGKSFGYRPRGELEEFRLPDLGASVPVGRGSR